MLVDFYRPTWVEVNLDAVEYNITQIQKILPSTSNIMAVVKANGYGHGSIRIAKKALQAGAKALAVALLEEAIELRDAGIDVPILVLGWVDSTFAHLAAQHHVTLTVFQQSWLKKIDDSALKSKLNIHLKLDTGMGRIGVRSEEELKSILQELNRKKNIYLTGAYTHFATADADTMDYYDYQNSRFNEYLGIINDQLEEPIMIHAGNSAASIRFPKKMHNYIRFGISMYGLYPSLTVKEENHLSLKSSFSLHSRLIHVKKVEPNASISYGNTYFTSDTEWIGTVPIGYGDGWSRKLQGASVLVDGKRMPIIGRICMDQLMIRLDKEYDIGTKVTLIGEQNGEIIEVDEIADYLETINYEIPCMINERVPRVYYENNRVVELDES